MMILLQLDFWVPPSDVNKAVDVMVSPEFRSNFERFLENYNISTELLINDVERFANYFVNVSKLFD